MRFVSTGGGGPAVSLHDALLAGLAPDGGLYLPDFLPTLPPEALAAVRGRDLAAVSATLGRRLFQPLGAEVVDRVLAGALDFPMPLVPLDERTFVLELTHGPTLAFKDVGARVLARLLVEIASPDERPLTVLTATSGDTGGAVAHAFHALPGVRVEVLYPHGQVSPFQERQFATLGGNVRAWAVRGTFDDCQRLVKEAFRDAALREALRLTSANSINVGRLLPQVLYYAHAWAQLPEGLGDALVSVPSGNLGNLTAGAMAKRMGVPLARLVAAANANDVMPEFLRAGRFTPRASRRTISSAMDVGNPGNLDRLRGLYGGDLAAMRRDIVGSAHSDEQTRDAMRVVYERHGYVMDPHTAVAYAALARARADHANATGVVLATAHPAKFAEIVEPVIGASVELPPPARAWLARSVESTPLVPDPAAFRAALLA